MRTLRTVLFYVVLVSLLSVPYAFFAYVCYLGLCGGQSATVIAKQYTTFYGYFLWVYPLVTFFSLFMSRLLKKDSLRASIAFLIIPLICFIPFLYVEFQTEKIESFYQNEQKKMNTVTPHDYACAPGKFIRKDHNIYYFFDYNLEGDSGSMTGYYSVNALKEALAKDSIDLSQCKNQAEEIIR